MEYYEGEHYEKCCKSEGCCEVKKISPWENRIRGIIGIVIFLIGLYAATQL